MISIERCFVSMHGSQYLHSLMYLDMYRESIHDTCMDENIELVVPL